MKKSKPVKKVRRVDLSDNVLRRVATSMNRDIALVDNFKDIKNNQNKVRLDVLMIGICTSGKNTFEVNHTFYTACTNNLIICSPNIMLGSGMISLDFEGKFILISQQILKNLATLSLNSWYILQFINEYPILLLKPDEIDSFSRYYGLLKKGLSQSKVLSLFYKERLLAILQALIYDLHDVFSQRISLTPLKNSLTAGSTLFRKFIHSLSGAYPRNRQVAYYADTLCVTPKHLSHVCKQNTGKTASELIDQYVLKDIRELMKDLSKGIQEISFELDFPNVSFFGRYVKRNLGMSPKAYRSSLINPGK